MEIQPWNIHPSNEVDELVGEGIWLLGFSVLSATNERIAVLTNSKAQQSLRLLSLPPTKFCNGKFG